MDNINLYMGPTNGQIYYIFFHTNGQHEIYCFVPKKKKHEIYCYLQKKMKYIAQLNIRKYV